ncbi:hypothetical protein GCM10010970_06220 [Silvimonas iriomotensis]|uniref:Uncharacterized protein n=1 Tax=Silvimonas iriomotensis TaxID=449662 RepID=A0ABQ2P593_9NEIS|nr:hypothetical protein GCM10010970_06220 [Silvimonas iriomotensis]
MLERALAGTLDHRAIGHRVRKRHPEFNDIGPALDQRVHQFNGDARARITRSNERNQSLPVLLLECAKRGLDSGHDFVM